MVAGRRGGRWAALAAVAVLGVLQVLLWIGTAPWRQPRPEHVYPANRLITMGNVARIDKAVRAGERVSILTFQTEGAEGNHRLPGGRQPGADTRFIESEPFSDSGVLQVRGTFAEVRDLRDGFKDLGLVRQDVPARMHVADPTLRRLGVLRVSRTGQPVLLLAISVGRSTSITNGWLLGPLQEIDVPLLSGLVAEMQRPQGPAPIDRAEALLRSPNPWLAWLGLVRLREHKALGIAHFHQLIAARPAEDTGRLAEELFFGTLPPPRMRAQGRDLQALLRLPGKNLTILRELKLYIEQNAQQAKLDFDIPRLHGWLVRYKAGIAADPQMQDVTEAVDQLLRVLPE